MAKIQYWKNKQGLFNYHVVGNNGQILVSVNQGFTRKYNMVRNVKTTYKALFNALSGTSGSNAAILSKMEDISLK